MRPRGQFSRAITGLPETGQVRSLTIDAERMGESGKKVKLFGKTLAGEVSPAPVTGAA